MISFSSHNNLILMAVPSKLVPMQEVHRNDFLYDYANFSKKSYILKSSPSDTGAGHNSFKSGNNLLMIYMCPGQYSNH